MRAVFDKILSMRRKPRKWIVAAAVHYDDTMYMEFAKRPTITQVKLQAETAEWEFNHPPVVIKQEMSALHVVAVLLITLSALCAGFAASHYRTEIGDFAHTMDEMFYR